MSVRSRKTTPEIVSAPETSSPSSCTDQANIRDKDVNGKVRRSRALVETQEDTGLHELQELSRLITSPRTRAIVRETERKSSVSVDRMRRAHERRLRLDSMSPKPELPKSFVPVKIEKLESRIETRIEDRDEGIQLLDGVGDTQLKNYKSKKNKKNKKKKQKTHQVKEEGRDLSFSGITTIKLNSVEDDSDDLVMKAFEAMQRNENYSRGPPVYDFRCELDDELEENKTALAHQDDDGDDDYEETFEEEDEYEISPKKRISRFSTASPPGKTTRGRPSTDEIDTVTNTPKLTKRRGRKHLGPSDGTHYKNTKLAHQQGQSFVGIPTTYLTNGWSSFMLKSRRKDTQRCLLLLVTFIKNLLVSNHYRMDLLEVPQLVDYISHQMVECGYPDSNNTTTQEHIFSLNKTAQLLEELVKNGAKYDSTTKTLCVSTSVELIFKKRPFYDSLIAPLPIEAQWKYFKLVQKCREYSSAQLSASEKIEKSSQVLMKEVMGEEPYSLYCTAKQVLTELLEEEIIKSSEFVLLMRLVLGTHEQRYEVMRHILCAVELPAETVGELLSSLLRHKGLA